MILTHFEILLFWTTINGQIFPTLDNSTVLLCYTSINGTKNDCELGGSQRTEQQAFPQKLIQLCVVLKSCLFYRHKNRIVVLLKIFEKCLSSITLHGTTPNRYINSSLQYRRQYVAFIEYEFKMP